jgi:5-methylcytosine-specific restriction endonuclease McrA
VARLVDRDGNHCWYCGITFSDGDRACTVDHVLPRSRGGTNVLANLRLACFYCNNRRGRMPAGVFEHSDALAARRRQAYRAEMLNTGRWLPKRAFHHAGIRWFGAQSWQCDDCSQGSLDDCASPASVRSAAKKCHVKANVADGGKTISFDTAGEEDYGVGDDIEDVACVLLVLRAPSYVVTEIDNTRALDGMQRDSWRKFKASWTYHPDDGLNIVIHE